MLKKILFQFQNKNQLYFALFGTLLGISFLMISIHYLTKINAFGKESESLGKNTLIIQKSVSNLNTLNLAKNNFSSKELNNLEQQDFIKSISPIVNNGFDITIKTNSELVPYFRTDIFVQSVDYEMLDVRGASWGWNENDEYVPIIMPREFLVMLNTFASAKGIPQISDDLAMSLDFIFTLSSKENQRLYNVKIVGFTNELSSIIVPSSFMEYGNKMFPSSTPTKTTQIMVDVVPGKFGEMEKLMKKTGLEAKKSSLILGKVKSISAALFSIIIGISFVTLLLAGLVLTQYTMLTLQKSQYEIRTLLRIGYNPTIIQKNIRNYFTKWIITTGLIGTGVYLISQFFINTFLEKSGIYISGFISIESILALVIVLFSYVVSIHVISKKNIFNLK